MLLLIIVNAPIQSLGAPTNLKAFDGASQFWLEDYMGPKYWNEEPENGLIISSPDGNQLVPGPDDEIRIIVQLDTPSVAEYQLSLSQNIPTREKQVLLKEQSQTITESQEEWITSIQEGSIDARVITTHQFLSNSITLLTASSNIRSLQDLPQVEKVTFDYEVKAHLADSVPLIGADDAWALTTPSGIPITGIDKIIAVIDSGIDYTHPDLGGCFGSGCKVLGGYDFINIDADPMDDFGHGTHVAGIISANGTLMGVAPDSLLLAYKVIDENGSGFASDVISALEHAVLAHADVINISLGGPGNPDDPLCQSVDLATQMGSVVVVSAGNRGSGYATIDSPGVAATAITVGASTKSDVITSFSSRGPVANMQITAKPDLIAPGQSINSTVPATGLLGNSSLYRVLSGTSMAAPHVTGAVALLRQYRPSWSPELIKSTLMNLAIDKGYNHFIQGSGRLDISQLDQISILISTPIIDFTIDDLSLDSWIQDKSVTITNWEAEPKNFTLSLPDPLLTGINLSINPTNFILAPGQSQEVRLQLVVDNLILPNAISAPYSYMIFLQVDDGIFQRKIPCSFVKMPLLDVQVNDDPWVIIVHNRLDILKSSSFDYHPIYFLPDGTYDVLIQFLDGKTRIVKENISVNTFTHLEFNMEDAHNRVDLIMKDIYDQEIPFEDLNIDQRMPTALVFKNTDFGLYSLGRSCIGDAICDHLMFSDISDSYTFEITIPAQSVHTDQDYYRFYHKLSEGIYTNLILENDPMELKSILFQYPVPEGSNVITIVRWIGSKMILSTDQSAFRTISAPYTEQAYYQPVGADGVMILEMLGIFDGPSVPSSPFPGQYQTPLFFASDPSTLSVYSLEDLSKPLSTNRGDIWEIGLTPPHWMAELGMDESSIWADSIIGGNALFASQYQDFESHGSLPFTLNKNNLPMTSGLLRAGQEIPLAGPGSYSLNLNYAFFDIGVVPGDATVSLEFDTTRLDPIPPVLTSLTIREDLNLTDILSSGIPATLEINFYDDSLIESIELFYRITDNWIEVIPIVDGNQATVTLPVLDDHTYIDLKIILEDQYHNKLTFTLEPGTLVEGNFQFVFPLIFN